jgi:hypothetical protein
MKLASCLQEKRDVILESWFQAITETYPSETAKLLKNKKKGRFANPVGYTISDTIGPLFDALLEGTDPKQFSSTLDHMMRVRVVQEFSPSLAVSFIFQLKEIIRSELSHVIGESGLAGELASFEKRIDDLAMFSFDLYMQCKETLYELRVKEFKSRAHMLLKRANMLGPTSKEQSLEF